jgi:hypothetical protein
MWLVRIRAFQSNRTYTYNPLNRDRHHFLPAGKKVSVPTVRNLRFTFTKPYRKFITEGAFRFRLLRLEPKAHAEEPRPRKKGHLFKCRLWSITSSGLVACYRHVSSSPGRRYWRQRTGVASGLCLGVLRWNFFQDRFSLGCLKTFENRKTISG